MTETQTSLFEQPAAEQITLSPSSSLALRRMIESLKKDDGVYSACPDVVKDAIADFVMPPYSTAETQIRALIEANEAGLTRLEQFGSRIREQAQKITALQQELAKRR